VVLLGLVALGYVFGRISQPQPVRLVAPTSEHIRDLAWLPDGRLYGLVSDGRSIDSAAPDRLMNTVAGKRWRITSVATSPVCEDGALRDLSILPDGRLGAVMSCRAGRDTTPEEGSRFAVALDRGTVTKLASLGGPNRLVAWNKTVRSGWVTSVSGSCDGIVTIHDGRVVPFPPYQPQGLLSWKLDQGLIGNPPCRTRHTVRYPTSSNSGELYFLASDLAGRLPGEAFAPGSEPGDDTNEWYVLAFDPATGELRKLAEGFSEPYDLAVVPDGSSLLLSGWVENNRGVWRIDPLNGERSLLYPGDYTVMTPAGDSRSVAVVRETDGGDEVMQLRIPSIQDS